MGWLEYHATHYKNGKVDRRAELDDKFNWEDESRKIEVLKSSMVGSTYYAAVKSFNKTNNFECVTAVVCLTSTNNKDYFNFAYKDMDESMGPCKYDCPKGILDLLDPTDYEYALNWRKACYENLEKKKDKNSLSKLPIGSEIKFILYGEEHRAYKHPPAYQFKRPFWKLITTSGYISVKRIPDDYEVVQKGEENA